MVSPTACATEVAGWTIALPPFAREHLTEGKINSESSDGPIQHGTRPRRRAGSLWSDLNATKKVVDAMAEAERRARHEKTLALRALRLGKSGTINEAGEEPNR